ncbi:alpha/beta hydrolase [Oceanobacillus halophilus]|uniref:Alpha/beta fold hydrolase n=1 Tax=Oceanobacillus halophilus TaxID=930130 RepID=A0A495A9F2_9BACI|nr:alpha/beta fold hydrolase [Oceanobacillus halophilus]RKQ35891.1 alpha/beta fold hydrolase [Oceanobacillus halophilus]
MGEKVLKGAEEFYLKGNDVGVLVIHGFTGTTQSMRFLGERIAEAGYTVYGPRLKGHGTTPENMEKASFKDWINNVEGGLEKLKETCSTIFVTGLSMGGTLTLYLAEKHPEIKGVMPINAAINMPDMNDNYEQLSKGDTRFVEGIGSDIKQENVIELAYKRTPVKSMSDLMELSKQVRENLGKVTSPSLIFKSEVDHVVPPENSVEIYNRISSENKSIVELKNSYHVATLDNDKELISEKSIEFIRSLLKN